MLALHDLIAAQAPAFLAHLWISTLVLAAALLVARFLRPLTARTRYAIVLAGIAKFAIPSSLFGNLPLRATPAVVGRLSFQLLGGPVGLLAPAAPPRPGWREALALLWLAATLLLLFRWWLSTRRVVASALRSGRTPTARELAALEAARRRTGTRPAIDLLQSAITEAPAVLRVIRPLIVLPSRLDELEDEEMEAILAHECAHVARRDNLIGVGEAIVESLFFFHPLLWIARRELARYREQACDETVAEANGTTETYVTALVKVCRLAITPRVAAVSCMASARIDERMNHLMRYTDLKTSAISHRLATAAAFVAVLLITAVGGIVNAQPASTAAGKQPYALLYTITELRGGNYSFHSRTIDNANGRVVATNDSMLHAGTSELVNVAAVDDLHRNVRLAIDLNDPKNAAVTMTVSMDGRDVQTTSYSGLTNVQIGNGSFTGEPISLRLKDAEIHDLIRVFGQLSGYTMKVADGINGSVSVEFNNVPWDEAFDIAMRQANLTWRVDGKTIYVTK